MNYCTHIPQSHIPAVHRMIVIGDLHGDWNAMRSALHMARVIDRHNQWVGGSTHVIQLGDILDRRSRNGGSTDEKSERKILRFLIQLKKKALRTDGDVHLLLGNHELMNVMGDFRYVSPLGLQDFDGERARQFRPGGKAARFLACNMNSVLQIGSWVFSHAGITTRVSKAYTVDSLNGTVRDFLLGNKPLDEDSGIMEMFWHRMYGTEESCPAVRDSLQYWQAKNMAIGHTVQSHGINSLCHGSLWKVDVGMSGAVGSHPVEVLEILDDGDRINILREAPAKRI